MAAKEDEVKKTIETLTEAARAAFPDQAIQLVGDMGGYVIVSTAPIAVETEEVLRGGQVVQQPRYTYTRLGFAWASNAQVQTSAGATYSASRPLDGWPV